MPGVSIVIPCYNHAEYLPDTVSSALSQTQAVYEIIIVNDGSTDNSGDIARILAEANPGVVKVIGQENRGLPEARNTGIRAAGGEYILPLDADDLIPPEYVESLSLALEEDPSASVAYGRMRMFGEVPEEEQAIQGWDYDPGLLLEKNLIPVCSMFRKKAWEEVGGYKPLKGYADWEFWIALLEAGHRFVYVDDGPCFLYRKHGESMVDRSLMMHGELCRQIRGLHTGLYDRDKLDEIIFNKDEYVAELMEHIGVLKKCLKEQSDYIEEIHTVRGFVRRAARALLRRAGVAG